MKIVSEKIRKKDVLNLRVSSTFLKEIIEISRPNYSTFCEIRSNKNRAKKLIMKKRK